MYSLSKDKQRNPSSDPDPLRTPKIWHPMLWSLFFMLFLLLRFYLSLFVCFFILPLFFSLIVFTLHSTTKSYPTTGLYRPLRLQAVEAPEFLHNRHVKVVTLSALRTGRLYPQEGLLVRWTTRTIKYKEDAMSRDWRDDVFMRNVGWSAWREDVNWKT
jgi:hypothetical protein